MMMLVDIIVWCGLKIEQHDQMIHCFISQVNIIQFIIGDISCMYEAETYIASSRIYSLKILVLGW